MSNALPVRRAPSARGLLSWVAPICFAACGTDPAATPPPDASTALDVALADVAVDAATPDVSPDAGTPDVSADLGADVPEATDPCAAEAIVDLDRRGTRTGNRTVFVGTTASGPPTAPWTPTMTCLSTGRAIRPVVHRFTTRSAANLRVMTVGGPDAAHDTVLWFSRTCTPTTAAVRACSDDALGTPQSRINIYQVGAGSTLHFVVATVAQQEAAPGRPYQLVIDEFATPTEGEACTDSVLHTCAAGLSCVEPRDSVAGVCRADGTVSGARCRTTGAACDDGLTCVGTTCLRPASAGQDCRAGQTTCGSLRCVNVDAADPRSGLCTAPGDPGGACAEGSCGVGLTCSLAAPTSSNPGLCQLRTTTGSECDPLGVRVLCSAPDECVPDPLSPARFHCAAPGTAPGARCRDGGGCDGDLRCNAAGGRGYCRATTAGSCSPTLASTDCGTGRTCAASGLLTGSCVAWTRESAADNDGVEHAEAPRPLPLAIRGALLPAGDVDCYRVELAHDGPLVFRVHDGTGRCASGPQPFVQVLDADEIEGFATYPGCVATSGTSGLRLRAGRYTVCVNQGSPVLDYFLTVSAP